MKITLENILSKFLSVAELVVIALILLNSALAIYNEGVHLITTKQVKLTDILLLFLYLEILAMIKDYVCRKVIDLKYPLYIAIISIARYVILTIKELSSTDIVWLSLSVLILGISVLTLTLKPSKGLIEISK